MNIVLDWVPEKQMQRWEIAWRNFIGGVLWERCTYKEVGIGKAGWDGEKSSPAPWM